MFRASFRVGHGLAWADMMREYDVADEVEAWVPPADHRVLLGMLTPSSNTVLEPVCAELLRDWPGISTHFARFRVTSIALDDRSLGQFDLAPMLDAAELLADARVRTICWNGTSASWLGLQADERLCEAITARTGIAATSSVLALIALCRRNNVNRLGLVTPYTADVQARIVATLRGAGIDCVAERRLDIADNFSFSLVSPGRLTAMIRDVAMARPDAIMVLCTNLAAAFLAPALEQETGILILDSVSAALWDSLRLAGVDPAGLSRFGRLFATPG
jgi:maleate isomerase